MKLLSFRIKNFRSIVDTGWCDFSSDNITALIGQNESGKTSILEALYCFEKHKLDDDYLRSDSTFPEVSCSFSLNEVELSEVIESYFKEYEEHEEYILPSGLVNLIKKEQRVNLTRVWSSQKTSKLILENPEMLEFFEAFVVEEPVSEEPVVPVIIDEEKFIDIMYESAPYFEYFEDFLSLLPNSIDLADLINENSKVEGYSAVRNLLKIAELDLSFLEKTTKSRMLDSKIETKSKEVTKGLQDFWSQRVGKKDKIKIEIELKNHDSVKEEKKGEKYLAFWVRDENEKLHPKQRSKGARWFLSFYLLLKAKSKSGSDKRVLLIDEPGASLHAKAQNDVLSVFENLSDNIQVIYTTHSPYLIKAECIYRLLAVQRVNEEDENSETQVLGVHKLASATTDTLSPILTVMGASFSDQQVIHKDKNILLEEVSAFYYITAFCKLFGMKEDLHFLPATGVSNVPLLANLLLGWGIEFSVVVDDDKKARGVYNELKRELFMDDDENAKKRMLKIKNCDGIEDIFSVSDFRRFVLNDESIKYDCPNSKYVKKEKFAKGVLASKFLTKVNNGDIKEVNFTSTSKVAIKKLLSDIEKIALN